MLHERSLEIHSLFADGCTFMMCGSVEFHVYFRRVVFLHSFLHLHAKYNLATIIGCFTVCF